MCISMNSDIAIVLKHLSGTVDVIDFNPSLKKSRVTCTIHNGTFPWKHNPWVTICVKFWQFFSSLPLQVLPPSHCYRETCIENIHSVYQTKGFSDVTV